MTVLRRVCKRVCGGVTHLAQQELAGVVEELGVVRSLPEGLLPHGQRLLLLAPRQLQLRQALQQGAAVRPLRQHTLTVSHCLIQPVGHVIGQRSRHTTSVFNPIFIRSWLIPPLTPFIHDM